MEEAPGPGVLYAEFNFQCYRKLFSRNRKHYCYDSTVLWSGGLHAALIGIQCEIIALQERETINFTDILYFILILCRPLTSNFLEWLQDLKMMTCEKKKFKQTSKKITDNYN